MALGANSGEAGPCCLHGGSLGLRLAFPAGSVQCLDELENVSHRAGAIEIFVEAVMSGAGYQASSQSRQR